MEPGPLPPHERTWRHPSELAAEQHALLRAETATPISRWFAVSAGSIGLVAVGLLALAVAPGPADAPIAISATTTPLRVINALENAAVSNVRTVIGLRGGEPPIATPIGDGRYALASAGGATAPIGATIEVRLPSGTHGRGRVAARHDGAVLVALDVPEPGHELADSMPAGDEVVTVLAVPPATIVLDDLDDLDVEDGTAVLDDDGRLVGVCRRRAGRIELAELSDELAAATNDG